MALAFTSKTQGFSTSDPIETASVTIASGSMLFLAVVVTLTTGAPSDSLSVGGLGGTWTKISTVVYGARRRLWVYRGTGFSSTSGAVSVDYTDLLPQEYGWLVIEVSGHDTTTPTESAVTNSGNAATSGGATTGGTPGSGDAVWAVLCMEDDENGTVESGWTEQGLMSGAANVRRIEAAYDATSPIDTSATWTWTNPMTFGAAALIVNVAAGGDEAKTATDANTSVTEGYFLTQEDNKTGADSGAGTDTSSALAATLAATDTAVGSDVSTLTADATATDANDAATESATASAVVEKTGADSGAATEVATAADATPASTSPKFDAVAFALHGIISFR